MKNYILLASMFLASTSAFAGEWSDMCPANQRACAQNSFMIKSPTLGALWGGSLFIMGYDYGTVDFGRGISVVWLNKQVFVYDHKADKKGLVLGTLGDEIAQGLGIFSVTWDPAIRFEDQGSVEQQYTVCETGMLGPKMDTYGKTVHTKIATNGTDKVSLANETNYHLIKTVAVEKCPNY